MQTIGNKFGHYRSIANQGFELEIGDVKQPQFHPQAKIKRWDNESNFSIRLLGFGTAKQDADLATADLVEWHGNGARARFYEHPDQSGFEFEVVFSGRPTINTVSFSIRHKGVVAYKQPELTPEQIAAGDIQEHGVAGGYVFYHANGHGNKYGTGNAFTIFRPWVEDATGWRVWCDLDINPSSNMMTITIPLEFYDQADWSQVTLDPTFGYTTAGGTSHTIYADNAIVSQETAPEAGTIDSIHFYARKSGNTNGKGIMYDLSGTDATDLRALGAEVLVDQATPQWWTSTVSGSPSIAASTAYGVGIIVATGGGQILVYYDSVGGHNRWQGTNTYTSPSDPWTGETNSTGRRYSFYVTYTASGGGVTVPVLVNHFKNQGIM